MADHDLLQALVALERESLQSRPPEWDAFARGEIDGPQVAARLRERGTSEAEIARGLELFAPPSAAFDEELLAKLVEGSASAAPADNVVDRSAPSWWRRRGAALVGAVAAAAAITIFVWPRSAPDASRPALVQLPAHDMSIQADAAVRGAGDDVVRVRPGSTVAVLLRPARAYAVAASVGVCLRHGDDVRVLASRTKPGKPGETLDVEVTLPGDLADGPAELVAVLAGGPLPTDVAASCASGGPDLQVVRAPVAVAR